MDIGRFEWSLYRSRRSQQHLCGRTRDYRCDLGKSLTEHDIVEIHFIPRPSIEQDGSDGGLGTGR